MTTRAGREDPAGSRVEITDPAQAERIVIDEQPDAVLAARQRANRVGRSGLRAT
ncbi:MAG: hypothetical protein M3Y06_03020 [Actinomycetota bacterium]|nr:hypothetical protein [Actinomycetota bacterium]